MAKKKEQKFETIEDYLLSQLDTPVILKGGSIATKEDGTPMTKQEAIATNILNNAMKGDVKAAQSDRFELSRQTGLRRKAKGKTEHELNEFRSNFARFTRISHEFRSNYTRNYEH